MSIHRHSLNVLITTTSTAIGLGGEDGRKGKGGRGKRGLQFKPLSWQCFVLPFRLMVTIDKRRYKMRLLCFFFNDWLFILYQFLQ